MDQHSYAGSQDGAEPCRSCGEPSNHPNHTPASSRGS
jgi:hypothetical protein